MILDIFNLPLFVTVVSYSFFFFVTVLFGIWVYLKSSRKSANVTFLLLCLSIGIYQIAHVFGITVTNSEASRIILMMTLSLIYVGCFTVHWIAAALEREKEHKSTIAIFYAIGFVLTLFYVAFPNTFLLESMPKLYFPNYYVAGSFHWLFLVYFMSAFFISMRILWRTYKLSDPIHKNRLSYYIIAITVGYPIGITGFLLAYGIDVDPIFSITFNFFVIPLAYGILRYDIMDIKSAARKTLSYTAFILGTALFILGTNLGNDFLAIAYPGIPNWATPLISSLLIVLFAGFLWERTRDLETLKYEFITVVTHKFRTPLTRIKWATEILSANAKENDDQKMAITEVNEASEHLVSLTDMLINLRKASEESFQYEFEETDICSIIDTAVKNMDRHIKDRNISFSLTCPSQPIYASMDKRRMLFALQIVLENAITYTPKGGSVSIRVISEAPHLYIKVKDSGIGISKDNLSKVFSKFWRSKEAKTTDTEGMGIGLFMAHEIIERHDGEITVESEGVGKGSTFTIKLPLALTS
jgi:signal transduction histidine kinase